VDIAHDDKFASQGKAGRLMRENVGCSRDEWSYVREYGGRNLLISSCLAENR
jgi:hypothetical protein